MPVRITVPTSSVPWDAPGRMENHITTYHGLNARLGLVAAGVDAYHPSGANFLFADGHVSFIGEDVDQLVLKNLTTRNGGELIEAGAY